MIGSFVLIFGSVSLRGIYPGIEVEIKVHGNNVEKLFHMIPGADPDAIGPKVKGCERLSLEEKGRLQFEAEARAVSFTRPIAYRMEDKKKKNIEVSYVISGAHYGFVLWDYKKTRPLVIAPHLATYIDGCGDDIAAGVASVTSGNIFVAGYTHWSYFPITLVAYQENYINYSDGFIRKFSSYLTTLMVSTFLADSNMDEIHGTIMGSRNGDILVTGRTGSSNFHFPLDGYSNHQNSLPHPMFTARMSNDLSTLKASAIIGGSGNRKVGEAIAVSSTGKVYVTGWTQCGDYSTTTGAHDGTGNGGNNDVIVSRLDANLTALEASGSSQEFAYAIGIVRASDIFIVGQTQSSNFPTTYASYQTTFGGGDYDVFISKFNKNLSASSTEVSVDPASIDFGTLSPGLHGEETFSIYNTGQGILTINDVTASEPISPIISTPSFPKVISSGASISMSVRFSASRIDTETGTSVIERSDPNNPAVRITPMGRGIPAVTMITAVNGGECSFLRYSLNSPFLACGKMA